MRATPLPQEMVPVHTTGSKASTAHRCDDKVRVLLLFPNCLRESPPGGMAASAVCSNRKEASADGETDTGSQLQTQSPPPTAGRHSERHAGTRPGVAGAGGVCLPGTVSGCCSSSVLYLHLETEALAHSCPAEGRRDLFANHSAYIFQRSLFTG